jgi:hypothetical protein
VSGLLDRPPYGPRDDAQLLAELNALTRRHAAHCTPYGRIVAGLPEAARLQEVPFLHVGLFKRGDFRTVAAGVRHGRTLSSSGTSGASSRIALDAESSVLQGRSAAAILTSLLGPEMRPLLVLDRAEGLRERGALSARLAAAMSLKPLAAEIRFLLGPDGGTLEWDRASSVLAADGEILVYGLTSLLWTAWAAAPMPPDVLRRLGARRIAFVHSGGWKKLEGLGVDAARLESALLARAGPGSRVLDLYGLVEQVGLLYPLCAQGSRHVPIWADVLVRDPFTLEPLDGPAGILQLANALALGAPYHCVLTEDLGRLRPGPCPCGRSGRAFELLGRVPKAPVRGCANV